MSPYSWNRIIRNAVDRYLALTLDPDSTGLMGRTPSPWLQRRSFTLQTSILLIFNNIVCINIFRLENYDHTLLIVIKDTNRSIFGAGMYVQYFIFKSLQDYVLYVH